MKFTMQMFHSDWFASVSNCVKRHTLDTTEKNVSSTNHTYKSKTWKRMKMAGIGRHLQQEYSRYHKHFSLSCQLLSSPQFCWLFPSALRSSKEQNNSAPRETY